MEVQQNQQRPSQFNQEAQPVISPGKWALYVFVSGLPLVGLIMLLVWAFGSDPNVVRRNWAKGMLLLFAILIVFYILLIFLIGSSAILGWFGSDELTRPSGY